MDNRMLEKLMEKMIGYDRGDPRRIQHLIKVRSLAGTIAALEGVSGEERFVTEAAAIVHDIGIHVCEEKYGACGGKLQEQEGPALARQMLGELGFPQDVADRVAFLVGHHHTYEGIDGADYQILVEADFLVNLYEDGVDREHIENACRKIFRTESGTRICRDMFGLD